MVTLAAIVWPCISFLLMNTNPTLSNIPDKIGIFPSEISTARYNFMMFSCFSIPIGWILANVFLYLYFKFDSGYFTAVKLEFRYKNGVTLRDPIRLYCAEKMNKCACCACCRTNLLSPEAMGDWVDTSSLMDEKCESTDEDEESEIETLLNLDAPDKIIFDDIKDSIPYYHRKQ